VTRRVLGLTGGIGSGKSSALAFFKRLGCATADADVLARRALRSRGAAARVKRLFGGLDRKLIAEQVFTRPALRRKLERIVHPIVVRELRRRTRRHRRGTLVLDIPLLYEARLGGLVDEVAVVWAPMAARLERLERRGMPRADALRRVRAQMPLEEKRRRADVVFDNSGPLPRLKAQIRAFLAKNP
jgi:dephospho-CoA kinase